MQLTSILITPIVTEKSSRNQEGGKYTFRVHGDANKVQIAQAVKAAYGVEVDSVNVMPIRKKFRLVGRGNLRAKRLASKRAIVTLAKKQVIDFNKFTTPNTK